MDVLLRAPPRLATSEESRSLGSLRGQGIKTMSKFIKPRGYVKPRCPVCYSGDLVCLKVVKPETNGKLVCVDCKHEWVGVRGEFGPASFGYNLFALYWLFFVITSGIFMCDKEENCIN